MSAADTLGARIDRVALRLRPELRRLQAAIARRERRCQPTSELAARLRAALAAAEALTAERAAIQPRLEYPSELPISSRRAELLEALRERDVVIVCGQTGSGKTTQLPKLCLEAGLGRFGMIGLTQPRRLAARAVATRLAEETGLVLGRELGLKLRFTDRTTAQTLVKVMTDGILLNEIRHDRLLRAYDTLIIDEAHERSLNIDFLLGYLKRIRAERPDLRIVVTSATIDPQRFAAHFAGAPIIEVEGRSFPIEIRYRAPRAEQDWLQAIGEAVHELEQSAPADPGDPQQDVLVFLPGERWIREAERGLRAAHGRAYEILPLYARLSAAQQERVFHPGRRPRLVLATNVAETSLTVPRIRHVIDTGLARVSRYAPRRRLRGLAVEPIAQANAAQRAGRCGRLAPGICIRLYAEQEFQRRPQFGDPEILRADLAGVILRLESLGLGHIDAFPFLDQPPAAAVTDAYRVLEALGAMDAQRRLTAEGTRIAQWPVEPRLGRLLGEAQAQGALREGLVIAAALSAPDPREAGAEGRVRPGGEEARSESDFVVLLELWREYRARRAAGWRALRAWCAEQHLSMARLGEWEDVHRQLSDAVRELGAVTPGAPASYKAIHLAVLAAFIDQVFEHETGLLYRDVHGGAALLGSATSVVRRAPRWLVAAERVATERVYLRTVARINPRWILELVPERVNRRYEDPAWDPQRGRVLAREIVQYGAHILSAQRRVDYGRVAPRQARELFVRDALVAARLGAPAPFLLHNERVRHEVLDWEARLRVRDLLVGEAALCAWYEQRLPQTIRDRASLQDWCARTASAQTLEWQFSDIALHPLPAMAERDYPDRIRLGEHTLELRYRFDPTDPADGLTVRLPALLLPALRAEQTDWLVPGWLADKALALLRSLPKQLRRALVPLPDTVAALRPMLQPRSPDEDLSHVLCRALRECRHLSLSPAQFDRGALPVHLQLRIELIDEAGAVQAVGRDLRVLQQRFAAEQGRTAERAQLRTERLLRAWDCGTLAEEAESPAGSGVQLIPVLVDRQSGVQSCALPIGPAARTQHRAGVRRLLLLALPQQIALLRRDIEADRELLLCYHGIGTVEALIDDVLCAAAEDSFRLDPPIRDRETFLAVLDQGRGTFVANTESLLVLLRDVLGRYRGLRARLRAPARVDAPTRAAIEAHLARLIHARCLTATPREWRSRLPCYLRAVEQRWDRLLRGSPKDAEQQQRLALAEARLADWQDRLPPDWPWPPAIMRYRWLLEEFRVSLFAQALGTVERVSERRLEEFWRAAQADQSADFGASNFLV